LAANLDIAVIGAGVAGLANAIALARHGHRVTVYERFDTSRPIGSGLMMQPPGLAALDRLGLRHALEQLGHRIDRLHGLTERGRTIFNLCYGDLDRRHYALAVHRAALHGVLWEGFKRSGAALETGRTIAGVEHLADGRVAPVDESGRRLPAAALVIDASGARSCLRALVSGPAPRPFAYGAVWATVDDIALAPNCLAQRYVAARIMIGYLPIGRMEPAGRPLAAFFWSLKPDAYAAWRARFADWRAEVVRLWPDLAPIVATLDDPDKLTLAGYTQFTASRLSRGNLVLTGDSAHATSPQLGQGANQGIIDAVVLADALAACAERAEALALYARLRRRHVRFYQLASAVMTPFFQSDSRLFAMVRDQTFDRMRYVPYLRREMIRTLAGLKTGLFTSKSASAIADCVPANGGIVARLPAR